MMYLHYYGLSKEPFHITPDPEFLYLSESHQEALGSIMYGILKKKGFVAITGGVGVGKTMIVRSYLEQTRGSSVKPIYIFNPNVSFEGLLKIMHEELGLRIPETGILVDLISSLYVGLIDEFRAGNTIALIVDEAQNMPIETLENLRMLSNLETVKDKLIQIVLIGQPEFDKILDRPDLKQLQQRISVRTSIAPLSAKESRSYIYHRLVKAGLMGKPMFSDGALRSIIREAKGIPRAINILCDGTLVTGCGYGKKVITHSIVREVVADFRGTKKSDSTPRLIAHRSSWGYMLAVGSVTALILLAFLLGGLWGRQGARIPLAAKPSAEATHLGSQTPPIPLQVPSEQIKDAATAGAPGPQEAADKPPSQGVAIKVKEGDTLSSLILKAYGENERRQYKTAALLKKVVEENEIADSNRIETGKTIVFPRVDKPKGR